MLECHDMHCVKYPLACKNADKHVNDKHRVTVVNQMTQKALSFMIACFKDHCFPPDLFIIMLVTTPRSDSNIYIYHTNLRTLPEMPPVGLMKLK